MIVDFTGVISFDLDSTVCDTRHRQHMIVKGFREWDDYSAKCVDDGEGPALPLMRFCESNGIPYVVCSGRSESARDATVKWFSDRSLYPWKIVLDGGDHGTRPHGQWKAEKLAELDTWCAEKLGKHISFHVDDHPDVVISVQELTDIPVMRVAAPVAKEATGRVHLG